MPSSIPSATSTAAAPHRRLDISSRRKKLVGIAVALLIGLLSPRVVPADLPPPTGNPLPAPNIATAGGAAADTKKLVELDPKLFPVPAQLVDAVDFWTQVYTRYHNDQVLLHDELHLHVIYAVLDLSELDKNGVGDVRKEQIKRQQIRETADKYRSILVQLAAGKPSKVWPQDSARVEALFAKVSGGNAKYTAAAERIRSQTCLRNRFAEAIYRSGYYMPEIERTFRERSLPVELSRLPFVESLFQWNARSNVAAGGIWQFMPATGRLYGLRAQAEYDERFDPLRATSAAARLLGDNFKALGTWPLALTAYNHGQGGMRRAVRVMGTTDMGVIATRYTGRAFGFASRNFYAEFLAAAKIYANREHYFPGQAVSTPIAFEEFRPSQFVKVTDLARKSDLDLDALRELNPALSKAVWEGRMRLPRGYPLKVPPGKTSSLTLAYASLPADSKSESQSGGRHTVRRGDTLGKIANLYGTTIGDLQNANRLASAHQLRIGQELIVPGREKPATPVATSTVASNTLTTSPAATSPAAASPLTQGSTTPSPAPTTNTDTAASQLSQHVVKKGDTLEAIARRYGVTIDSLRRTNKLRNHLIHPAQVLVIPATSAP